MSVTPIRPDLAPTPICTQLAESLASCIKKFEAESDDGPPTGAVWVVFNDKGSYRSGWDATNSALPGTAIVGMAIAALTAR